MPRYAQKSAIGFCTHSWGGQLRRGGGLNVEQRVLDGERRGIAHEGVILVDTAGSIRYWSAGAERLCGWRGGEVVGLGLVDLVPAEGSRREAEQLLARARGGEEHELELTVRGKEGTNATATVTASPVFDDLGGIAAILVMLHAVAPTDEIGGELQDDETRLRLALEAGRLGTWAWDVASGSLTWDETLESLFGLQPGEFDGRFDTFRALIHPDDRDSVIERIQESLASGRDHEHEHRVLLPDGTTRWIEGRGRVVRDAGGRISGMIGVAGDITERKSLEQYRARLLENERTHRQRLARIARTLQQTLLPPVLPSVPGLELAAEFSPAGEGLDIGGDFYDVFENPSGTWSVLMGDVRGKGADAARVTALVRYTLKAARMHNESPTAILQILNEDMLTQLEEEQFATLAYAHIRIGEPVEVSLAVAGHPLPLLLPVAGDVVSVGQPGSLVGMLEHIDFTMETVTLDPGDALVLYTDGVTDARGELDDFGIERLKGVVDTCRSMDARSIARAIATAVDEHQHGVARDDRALLVLRAVPPSES